MTIITKDRSAAPQAAPGWLRSRFMRREWPRLDANSLGVAPCGRPACAICSARLQQDRLQVPDQVRCTAVEAAP